jgi:3-oxoacyl-[acyl-carrier-protein] synthase III
MRIDAAAVVLPSRELSNDDVVALIREHSLDLFPGDLEPTLKQIAALLRRSGARSRYWLGAEETPIGLISRAAEAALDEARCDRAQIELLVYTGVDRGFLDPAMAYFVADGLGMARVHCFDVVDACNGWSRALQLTQALFESGTYSRAMLIAGEFPMFEGGAVYPDLFRLRSIDEVARSFAGYTLGEAATAVVLSHDPGSAWQFRFSSRADLAHLCTVPLPGYDRYATNGSQPAANGVGQFVSHGAAMFSAAKSELTSLVRQLTVPLEEVAAIVPHAATSWEWEQGVRALGLDAPLLNVYPRFGNLVAASIPAGIACAVADHDIARGDRILCLSASAGMSFSAYSFVY